MNKRQHDLDKSSVGVCYGRAHNDPSRLMREEGFVQKKT